MSFQAYGFQLGTDYFVISYVGNNKWVLVNQTTGSQESELLLGSPEDLLEKDVIKVAEEEIFELYSHNILNYEEKP